MKRWLVLSKSLVVWVVVVVMVIIFSGCSSQVLIPIEINDPGIRLGPFTLPSGSLNGYWDSLVEEIYYAEIQNMLQTGSSGIVSIQNIEKADALIEVKIVSGNLKASGYGYFSTEYPYSLKPSGDLRFQIDTDQKRIYYFNISTSDSPGLSAALRKLKSGENVKVYAVTFCESGYANEAVFEVRVKKITFWIRL